MSQGKQLVAKPFKQHETKNGRNKTTAQVTALACRMCACSSFAASVLCSSSPPSPPEPVSSTMARPKRAAAAKAQASSQEASPQKKAKGGLAVGDQLPEFELETDEQQTVSSVDMVSLETHQSSPAEQTSKTPVTHKLPGFVVSGI